MTPREATLAMTAAADTPKEPGVRTSYSARERALLEVLVRVALSMGYGAAVEIFERESDGLTKIGEGGDGVS